MVYDARFRVLYFSSRLTSVLYTASHLQATSNFNPPIAIQLGTLMII
jgi:hypothetical protein